MSESKNNTSSSGGGDLKIIYCTLHGNAPELLDALKASAEFGHKRGAYHAGSLDYCTKRQCIAAREAIRRAEGNG